MASINLLSLWAIYVRELEQLFKYDPEVHVVYDSEKRLVTLYVDDDNKAAALEKLIPERVEFGSVVLLISIAHDAPASLPVDRLTNAELYKYALQHNGALSFIKTIHGVLSSDLTYVVFRHEIVQYFTDDLGDVYGQTSTLFQNIARHIFSLIPSVFFCTDVPEDPGYKSGKSLEQWP